MSRHKGEGSVFLGLLCGFFLGLIGLILTLVLGKSRTKRGAIIGFILSLAARIGLVAFVIFFEHGMSLGLFDGFLDTISQYINF